MDYFLLHVGDSISPDCSPILDAMHAMAREHNAFDSLQGRVVFASDLQCRGDTGTFVIHGRRSFSPVDDLQTLRGFLADQHRRRVLDINAASVHGRVVFGGTIMLD